MRSRKRLVVLTGGGAARLGLLAISIVPFATGDSGLAVVSLVGLNAIRAVMGNFCNPAWTSWSPTSCLCGQGQVLRPGNVAVIAASIVASPIAGRSSSSFPASQPSPSRLPGHLLLSFAVGLLSTASFSRIPDASVSEASAHKPKDFPLRAILADRRFLGFVLSAFVWNTALQVSSPFFNVYLVSRLGASAAMVGLLTAVSSVFTLVGQLTLGPVTDRKGDIFVFVLTGLLIPLLPASWILVNDPRQVILINTASGILWAGYNLACFNILLKLTPDDHRAEATAIYQTLVTASAVLGPLVGGALADSVGYQAVFALSGIGRLAGTLLFIAVMLRSGPLKARR